MSIETESRQDDTILDLISEYGGSGMILFVPSLHCMTYGVNRGWCGHMRIEGTML